jgi:hypothetical protein
VDELESVKAPLEVHGGLGLVLSVAHEQRLVAFLLQDLRQRRLPLGYRLPALEDYVLSLGGSQSLKGQALMPVWMALLAQIVGADSG